MKNPPLYLGKGIALEQSLGSYDGMAGISGVTQIPLIQSPKVGTG